MSLASGKRLVLGATPAQLRTMVLGEGFWTMAPAVIAGTLAGALLSRFAVGVIYGVKADPYDPTVYLVSISLLVAAGLAALWLPARKAGDIPLTDLLRG